MFFTLLYHLSVTAGTVIMRRKKVENKIVLHCSCQQLLMSAIAGNDDTTETHFGDTHCRIHASHDLEFVIVNEGINYYYLTLQKCIQPSLRCAHLSVHFQALCSIRVTSGIQPNDKQRSGNMVMIQYCVSALGKRNCGFIPF